MILRNKSGDARWLPDLGVNVGAGETFEATGDLAEQYLAQPWCVRVDTPARQKAAKARAKPAEPTPDPAPAAAENQE